MAVCQTKIDGSIQSIKEPIQFASVALYSLSDSALYKACLSDSAGAFRIEDIIDGKYLLKVQYIGFSEYVDTLSLSAKSLAVVHLGDIHLAESTTMLKGVEVVAKRPLIERINNITVMNVELASAFIGDNAFELLKKVPGIVIDMNGGISLYYKSINVTLDNRELNLGGNELTTFLKSIPFAEVIKLEVNSNPSAKFDAEGAGGIVNIVTKKRIRNGLHGSVSAYSGFSFDDGFRGSPGISAFLSAKVNKFSIVASLGIQYQSQCDKVERIEKMFVNDGVFERQINAQNDNNHWSADNTYLSPSARLEVGYAIDEKSSINLSFRANHNYIKGSSQSYNRLFFNSPTPDSSFLSKSKSSGSGTFYSTNLNYSYLFNSKKGDGEISIDINYSPYVSSEDKLSQEDTYFHGDFIGESYRTYTMGMDLSPSFAEIVYTKVDYSQAFTPKINFSAGLKYTFVSTRSNFKQSFNGLFDSLSYNSLNFIENIGAAYASLSYQINDNNYLNIGLRGEYTFSKMDQYTLDSTYSLKPYFNLFPNINYSLKIDDKNNLSLSYNYRISRAQYSDLDPKVVVNNEFSVNAGNIDLKPSYTHDVNLTHTYKNMLFSFIGYTNTKGMPYRFSYYNENSLVTTSKPENIGDLSAIYLGEQFVYSFTDWWNSNTYCNFTFLFNKFIYLNEKESLFSFTFSFGTYHTFTFLKHYAVEFALDWASKNKIGFTEYKFFPNVSVGLKANFLNNNLTLNLRVSPLRNKIKARDEYPNGNMTNTTLYQYNEIISLSISYRFGKDSFDKNFRNSEIEEISGRIKMK